MIKILKPGEKPQQNQKTQQAQPQVSKPANQFESLIDIDQPAVVQTNNVSWDSLPTNAPAEISNQNTQGGTSSICKKY